MSDLIDRLKQQHKHIVENIPKLESQIFSAKWKEALLDFKKDILNHLSIEDNELYPLMKEHALDDFELGDTLDLFARDMEVITGEVLSFFAKYENDTPKSEDEFLSDFNKIIELLSIRILREESVLYHEYEELER